MRLIRSKNEILWILFYRVMQYFLLPIRHSLANPLRICRIANSITNGDGYQHTTPPMYYMGRVLWGSL